MTSPHRDYVTVDGVGCKLECLNSNLNGQSVQSLCTKSWHNLDLRSTKQARSGTGLNLVGLAGSYLLHVYYGTSILAV